MQAKHLSSWLLLSIFLCMPAAAQQPSVTGPFGYSAGRLESMKLISPEIGWAATRNHLFWTADDGQHWRDITPKPATSGEAISAVFFLDHSTGWVLFAGGGNDEDQPRYDLASTTDAGDRWALSQVKISGLNPPEAMLTGSGYMYFLDQTHGWINLTVATGSAFHGGAALSTQDGGKAWDWVPMGSGSSGPIMFTSLKDGWILSPDQTQLDVTHDGSKSWQKVSLQAPPFVHGGAESANAYFMPILEDGKHGFLIVSFPNSAPVLYRSGDGGVTWKPERLLPLSEASAMSISRSTFFAASISQRGSVALTTLPLANSASQAITAKAELGHVEGLHGVGGDLDYFNFFDELHGWLLAGELLSTPDGGKTWADITPPGARPATHAAEPSPRSALPPDSIGPLRTG